MTGVIAGLAASLCWTVASFIWRSSAKSLSAIQLNGIKNGLATIIFLPVFFLGSWGASSHAFGLLFLSGTIGISLGDSCYISALNRLGTRRTLTIEAVSPVLAIFLGKIFLAEIPSTTAWIGTFLVSCSVVWVALQSPPPKPAFRKGDLTSQSKGFVLAFGSVLFGLLGAMLSRLVLLGGEVSPLQTSSFRLLSSFITLTPFLVYQGFIRKRFFSSKSIHLSRLLVATFVGTNLAILLQQITIQTLPLGKAITLLSMGPVMASLLSGYEGEKLNKAGLGSAFLSVFGVGLALW